MKKFIIVLILMLFVASTSFAKDTIPVPEGILGALITMSVFGTVLSVIGLITDWDRVNPTPFGNSTDTISYRNMWSGMTIGLGVISAAITVVLIILFREPFKELIE